LLFGYDTAVISGAISYFELDFGLSHAGGGWVLAAALIGAAFGALIAGPLSDRLGRKPALVVAALLFLVTAVGAALAGSALTLVIARALGGIGVGIVSIVSPLYIAEIAPPGRRGRMVATFQLALVTGILLV
jgi:MFS family permease